ncbi:unnamed protein product [Larinioides sclopetarius]|uniref:Uncharacterized protein n=1 Tax=Larinioides sclopetarius TaxID=280406 RepID=A0AAV2ACP0_9ARAC
MGKAYRNKSSVGSEDNAVKVQKEKRRMKSSTNFLRSVSLCVSARRRSSLAVDVLTLFTR